MKTKLDLEWMGKVKEWCKFKHGLIVPSQGKSGGLAMFWREEVKLDIQTYSSSHIDAWVHGGDNVGWWHLTGFYGEPDTSKIVESWQKMKHLCGTSDLPWLIDHMCRGERRGKLQTIATNGEFCGYYKLV